MEKKLTVLCASAHPDDIELQCAGTLIRYVKEGHKVYMAIAATGNVGSKIHTGPEIEEIRASLLAVEGVMRYCARKRGEVEFGSEGQLSLGEMLAAFLHHQAASSNAEPAGPVPEPCPACGLTYERLVHTGKLGCGECFRHFGPQVERILRHVHGNVRHAGRSPRRGGGPLQVTLRVARLKRELAACVQAEDFERAAVLRDEIRALEGVPAG